jgi:hypothetical protein
MYAPALCLEIFVIDIAFYTLIRRLRFTATEDKFFSYGTYSVYKVLVRKQKGKRPLGR